MRKADREALSCILNGSFAADYFLPNKPYKRHKHYPPASRPPVFASSPPKKIGQQLNAKNRRQLREFLADGCYTDQEWEDLKIKYSNCCPKCGTTEERIVADHITPLFRGGSNGIENIQPLCWRCNLAKGLQIIDYRPDAD